MDVDSAAAAAVGCLNSDEGGHGVAALDVRGQRGAVQARGHVDGVAEESVLASLPKVTRWLAPSVNSKSYGQLREYHHAAGDGADVEADAQILCFHG